MGRVTVTDAAVRRLKAKKDGKRASLSDSLLRGFLVVAFPSGLRSFYAQAKPRGGKQVRVKVGDYPTLGVEEARELARTALKSIRVDGEHPRERERREAALRRTFGEAMTALIEARAKSPATRRSYERVRDVALASWNDRSLKSLGGDRQEWLNQFERITRDSGEASANLTMRIAKGAWRRARRLDPSLPPDPFAAIDWHRDRARTTTILEGDNLREWALKLAVEHPSKRDLLLTMALTGLRVGEASAALKDNLDADAQSLLLPRTKNGRPFSCPLNLQALRVLERAKARREGNGLLFPSPKKGQPWKDPRVGDTGVRPHDLRRLWGSALASAGVDVALIRALLNHVPRSHETAERHYLNSVSADVLRAASQKGADFIVARMGAGAARLFDLVD